MDQVMSIEAALAVADEVSPTPARAVTALKVLRAALLNATTEPSKEELANRMIDAWIDAHGQPIPWAKAVEIVAIITHLPDAERDRLLGLASVSPTIEGAANG